MLDLKLAPHETANETSDILDALARLMRGSGAFDGEAGDAMHTLLTVACRNVRELGEHIDPVRVAILPKAISSWAAASA